MKKILLTAFVAAATMGSLSAKVKTWDFTQWSEETVANLKADAAASSTEGWSDIEKVADASAGAVAPDATAGKCFWLTDNSTEWHALKANGVKIAELEGLLFSKESGARNLAIAVDYPTTSLGSYAGPAYLWMGGSNKYFIIKNVKVGTELTMVAESHKPTDPRGVQLYIGEVADANKLGTAFEPTTLATNTWTIEAEGDVVDVIVKNTNGCHIYSLTADITLPSEAKTWDFTQWSEETVANLKADAAASSTEGWSDIEKVADAGAGAVAPDATAGKCFWLTDNSTEWHALKANGVKIVELEGMVFSKESGARNLAIAVDYPTTSLGSYAGPAYLWMGGSNKYFIIKNVKVGTELTMVAESHKPTDPRGVQLYIGEVADANKLGTAFEPTTLATNTWTVEAEGEFVDVYVKNTNGCHIYSIDATVGIVEEEEEEEPVEPELVSYTVSEVAGDIVFRTTEGEALTGTEVKVPYRYYNANEGQLYKKAQTNKEFNYLFVLTAADQTEKLEYTAVAGTDNVVFISEGEDIEGLTVCSGNDAANSVIRSSNAAAAYAAEDAVITTLPAGTYKLHPVIFDASKTPDSYWSFLAGTDTIATLHCTTVNIQELHSDEFTLTEETEIIMAQGGSNKMGLDLIYITGTAAEEPEQPEVGQTYLWDFAAGLSEETIANLNADAANWTAESATNWYNNVQMSATEPLKANGVVIPETDGLLMNVNSNKAKAIYLYTSKFRLAKPGTLTFPKMANGQYITVVGASPNATATDRGISPAVDHLVFQPELSSSQTDGQCMFLGKSVEGSEGTYTFVWKVETESTELVDVVFNIIAGSIDFTKFEISNDATVGIEQTVQTAEAVKAVRMYNLAGQLVEKAEGIVLIQTIYADGTTTTRRAIVK